MNEKILAVLLATLFLVMGFAQQTKTSAAPAIKVIYKAKFDEIKAITEISVSGAMFTLQGDDGRWEKALARLDEQRETVEFHGFDPTKAHTLSVRFPGSQVLKGPKLHNVYKDVEDLKFAIPPGSNYSFAFAPAQCEGNKVDARDPYGLFINQTDAILPLGYSKDCKITHRWISQRK